MTLSNFLHRFVFAKRAAHSSSVPLSPAHTFITPSHSLWQSDPSLVPDVRGGVAVISRFHRPLLCQVGSIKAGRGLWEGRSEVWPRRFAVRRWRWAERTASACLRSPDSSTWTRPDSQEDRGRDEQQDTVHQAFRAAVKSGGGGAEAEPLGSVRLEWERWVSRSLREKSCQH